MNSLLAFFAKIDGRIAKIDCNSLRDILYKIDENWFKKRPEHSDNWVIRFNSISRLYKLMIGYYQEKISPHTEYLEKPNLTLIAREDDLAELYKFAVLVLALAVQSPQKEAYVLLIQDLPQQNQCELIEAINSVVEKLKQPSKKSGLLMEYQSMPLQPVTSQIWKLEGRTKQFSVLSAENEALKEENQRLLDLIAGGHTFQADSELKALKTHIASMIEEKAGLIEANLKQKQLIDLISHKSTGSSSETKKPSPVIGEDSEFAQIFPNSLLNEGIIEANLENSLKEIEALKRELLAAYTKAEQLAERNDQLEIQLDEVTRKRCTDLSISSAAEEDQISAASSDVIALQKALSNKEYELAQAHNQIQYIKASAKREQRLMMSAWYDLGLQFHRQFITEGPISWLAQQRQAMSKSARRGF